MAFMRSISKVIRPVLTSQVRTSSVPRRFNSFFPIDDSLYDLSDDQKQVIYEILLLN